MALERFSGSTNPWRLLFVCTPAEYVSPFNQFPIPEIASVAAFAGTSALDTAASVEPAPAVPVGPSLTAIEGLRALTAIPSGPGAALILNLQIVRKLRWGLQSVVYGSHKNVCNAPVWFVDSVFFLSGKDRASFMPFGGNHGWIRPHRFSFQIKKGFEFGARQGACSHAMVNTPFKRVFMKDGSPAARIGSMAREILATGLGNAFQAYKKRFSHRKVI
jgi:hypothetical protein